jgi:3-hydroxymyristoyl/3-hydroxydecanoyl-(acyl carrier protein) dehydratase
MKLKYEDIIKVAKYLEEHCKLSPVYVNPNDRGTALIINVTNTKQEKLTITIYDEQYYMNAKIVKEEEL